MAKLSLLLPSLKVSGGTLELLHLADDLTFHHDVELVSMWKSPHETSVGSRSIQYLSHWETSAKHALLQMPLLIKRFAQLTKRYNADDEPRRRSWIFSHYATFPLALCVSAGQRWYFVQDMEWRFIHHKHLSRLLKQVILFFYRRGHLISANAYLSDQMRQLGLKVDAEVPIWAAPEFQGQGGAVRDLDFVMVLRKGDHKRLDLYLEFLNLVRAEKRPWKLSVITPESDIAARVSEMVDECLLRPNLTQMQQIYARSKCFLHLSEHEGFGLPPLEAMGSGCVPVCRDSGGIRAYLTGELEQLIVAKELGTTNFIEHAANLVDNPSRMALMSATVQKVFAEGLILTKKRAALLEHLPFN